MAGFYTWLKSHMSAILVTTVALQNSHLLGAKATVIFSAISGILSALGGT